METERQLNVQTSPYDKCSNGNHGVNENEMRDPLDSPKTERKDGRDWKFKILNHLRTNCNYDETMSFISPWGQDDSFGGRDKTFEFLG